MLLHEESQVPHGVIETAVKGANLMGDGLYGVDMKQTDNGSTRTIPPTVA